MTAAGASVPGPLAGLRVIDLTGLLPARTLVLYWHRERRYRRALEPFFEAVREAGARLAAEFEPVGRR